MLFIVGCGDKDESVKEVVVDKSVENKGNSYQYDFEDDILRITGGENYVSLTNSSLFENIRNNTYKASYDTHTKRLVFQLDLDPNYYCDSESKKHATLSIEVEDESIINYDVISFEECDKTVFDKWTDVEFLDIFKDFQKLSETLK